MPSKTPGGIVKQRCAAERRAVVERNRTRRRMDAERAKLVGALLKALRGAGVDLDALPPPDRSAEPRRR